MTYVSTPSFPAEEDCEHYRTFHLNPTPAKPHVLSHTICVSSLTCFSHRLIDVLISSLQRRKFWSVYCYVPDVTAHFSFPDLLHLELSVGVLRCLTHLGYSQIEHSGLKLSLFIIKGLRFQAFIVCVHLAGYLGFPLLWLITQITIRIQLEQVQQEKTWLYTSCQMSQRYPVSLTLRHCAVRTQCYLGHCIGLVRKSNSQIALDLLCTD